MEKQNYQNKMQDKRLDSLEKNVAEIKNNHLPHIYTKLMQVGTDVDWLKRFFWIVATASIGGLIAALLNLLITINK
ncbi:MAG: hypothetical protein WC848_04445 [Parcubacteria group bacterium]|jgi:hypothetical protein